jgi:hypothetical protein
LKEDSNPRLRLHYQDENKPKAAELNKRNKMKEIIDEFLKTS